jgi:hypothetical protein
MFSASLARVWALGLAVLLTLGGSRALAQEPPDYRDAIEQAVAEYELGNFAEARAQFRKAHQLFPNARSYRGLGMSEFELRNYADAISDLTQALDADVKPLTGALRTQTEQLLHKARGYVARVQLELEPPTTSVLIDGAPVELGPELALLLDVGDHVLEFHAPGLLPQKRPLKVTGGEERILRVVLREDEPQPTTRRWYKNPWLWTAAGIVVAGAATGAAVALRGPDSKLANPEGGTASVTLKGPR